MQNFEYFNPVKILFGEGKIGEIADHIPVGSNVMLTYGGGSIKRNGVYEQVMASLSEFNVVEFGGIEPNPKYETLMRAVDLAREKRTDFILAVGGGSVIDGTKFISAAIPFKGDTWSIVAGGKGIVITDAVPFGSVLTLPATGSEMNSGAVVSRNSTQEKFAFGSPLLFPKFSVLDPTVTFSLPVNQVANGVVDAFVHVVEQYLTYPSDSLVQDRWAEGILSTLVEIGPKAISSPLDYQVRANLMWSCTVALNGVIAVGVPTDWATHMIGHELTALFGLDHAVTLAIVLPSLLRETREEKKLKLLQYGERVWGINSGDEQSRIDETINRTERFFQLLGIKTKLSDYNISTAQVQPISERFEMRRWKLGETRAITPDRVRKILQNSI